MCLWASGPLNQGFEGHQDTHAIPFLTCKSAFFSNQHSTQHRNMAPSSCKGHINQPWAPSPKIPGKDFDWPICLSVNLTSQLVYYDWVKYQSWTNDCGQGGGIVQKLRSLHLSHKFEVGQGMLSKKWGDDTKDVWELEYEDFGLQKTSTTPSIINNKILPGPGIG